MNTQRVTAEKGMMKRLFEIMQKKYFRHFGYTNFEAYVKAEFNLEPRKAYSLKRIYQNLHVEAGMPLHEVKKLPWTKADAIASIATEDNIDELAQQAKKMRLRDLQEEIARRRKEIKESGGSTGPTPERTERKIFYLYPGQMEVVDAAVKKASGKAKSEKEGHLLSLICSEWLALHVKGKDARDILAHVIACLTDATNYEIFAFDPSDESDRKGALKEILSEISRVFGVRVGIKKPKK